MRSTFKLLVILGLAFAFARLASANGNSERSTPPPPSPSPSNVETTDAGLAADGARSPIVPKGEALRLEQALQRHFFGAEAVEPSPSWQPGSDFRIAIRPRRMAPDGVECLAAGGASMAMAAQAGGNDPCRRAREIANLGACTRADDCPAVDAWNDLLGPPRIETARSPVSVALGGSDTDDEDTAGDTSKGDQ